ncbi:Fic family protein [Sporosarcina aquimarina]|uniref:Fic family protein n=1 Tax=Sporosarcina aquimarina TaxID=114975 RepID=UPI001C8EA193|nr:Fic family protein [Sporosarcina aquimarina]MBY0221777.1 Fic family protein [Sporosarcina aquimarina]
MGHLIENMTPEYLEDVMVRLAHHSCAIEGNTITLSKTVSILLNGTLPGSGNITRREFFEVDNHQLAFEYVISSILNNEQLSFSIIRNIHEKLTDRLQYDKGQFKKVENHIKGAEFSTVPPDQVPQLMDKLLRNLYYRLKNATTDDDLLKAILEMYIQFEKIHPFSDGNARAGRMIMNYSLLENDLPPLIIKNHEKDAYLQVLKESQMKEFPEEKDIENFVVFAKPILEEERKRMLSFSNKIQTYNRYI